MKKLYLILIILSLILPLIYAEEYGVEDYGCGKYGIGCSPTSSVGSAGGGGGNNKMIPSVIKRNIEADSNKEAECDEDLDCGLEKYCFENKCYDFECSSNDDCEENEACWDHKCIKWFDIEILEFESPLKVGEFFYFTCLLKAVAEINGDVEVKFWIEKQGDIKTYDQDTIYFSSFEEKIRTKKLFLPYNLASGAYTFHIEVVYGNYKAGADRTIGIIVDGDSAILEIAPKVQNITKYVKYLLTGLALLILFSIFYFENKKVKKELINDYKGIKRHKFLILTFLLFVVLGILAYSLGWFNSIAELITRLALLIKIYF